MAQQMKKAKKVRINKQDWKYFVDHGSIDEDGRYFSKVILYPPPPAKSLFWNIGEKREVGTPEVKWAYATGKFIIGG